MTNEALKFIVNRGLTENEERIFIFISANQGEGKTFTSLQTTRLFLEYFTEQRIALVDFNISNPEISRQIGDPPIGWSSICGAGYKSYSSICGTDYKSYMDNQKICYKYPSPEYSNLFFIPIGQKANTRNDSVKTINNLPIFIKSLRDYFDLILIDGPSVLQTSVTLNMASLADGVFMVVEAGRTRRQVVQKALDHLREAGAIMKGVIMNKRQYFIHSWLYGRLFK